jgi:hypothetical protein
MAKTLKDFLNERQLGPMVVKNPDEQKFIDKHAVAKTADRNGNDDELFKGSKVKMADRPKHRKGYNPGEDEEVYEELKGNQHKIDANKNGKVDAHDFHLLRKKKKVAEAADDAKLAFQLHMAKKREELRKKGQLAKEEAEQIDELSIGTMKSYGDKRARTAFSGGRKPGQSVDAGIKMKSKQSNSLSLARTKINRARDTGSTVLNKEEIEQIDELSHDTLRRYRMKSKSIADNEGPLNYREKGRELAGRKSYGGRMAGIEKAKVMAKEEAELEEKLDMKKASMGTVVKDFQKSDAPQFQGKSQKKRQVMAVAAKLTAERGKLPMNKEQRLLVKLDDLAEVHKRTMVSVFEKLNEDNQREFMLACDTAEGIEQMLDFSISYRGE